MLRRRQVPTYFIGGGVPGTPPEKAEGLRLHLLQAQAYERKVR